MTEVKAVPKSWIRFSYILRRSAIISKKVKPFPIEERPCSTLVANEHIPTHPPSTLFADEPISARPSSIFPANEHISTDPTSELSQKESVETQQIAQTTERSSNDDIFTAKRSRTPTPLINKSSVVSDEVKIAKEEEKLGNGSQNWFYRLTPKQKTFLIFIIVFLLIVVAAAAVVPPVYLFVISQPIQESSFTNYTASTCSATTCIGKETPYRTSMVTALYPFDGNSEDLTGYAPGIPFGSTYPVYSTTNYVGSYSLVLTPTSFQYIQIPYVNLTKSFTIEAWVYPTSAAVADYGIFGQCDSNFKCLSISLRNSRFTLAFDSMNINNYTLVGASVISLSIWTHLAIVYDAVLYQQQIYVNGHIDAITNGITASFAGTSSGSITTIGRSLSLAYGTSYFQGRIDHFVISAGATRTACQISNDASLVAYYPFDTTATFNDYSVNLFQGMAYGTTTISQGHSGQAIYFSSNVSYFQAECFPIIGTGPVSFSMSLWINPDSITGGGSVIHVSSLQNGSGTCYDLLTFTSTGALVVQLMQTTAIVGGTQGPIIPANTWTHVAVVFGGTNGLRIYINGQLNTVSITNSEGINGVTNPQYITLGNNTPLGQLTPVNCRNGSIPIMPGPYKGAIDDFRLYSRELDNEEICVLAGN